MNGEAFATYVETQLAPALEPGTVVILDNLSTHRNARAARALSGQGCWSLFLRPTPGPEPDRDGLLKTQGAPARDGARTFDQLLQALGETCDLFTPDECWNYFRHAGYVST